MARATRIALDMALEASKSLKSVSRIAWQYAKVEVVPPMTLNFFHGPGGRALENAVSNATNKFIGAIQNQIKEIEAEKVREIKRKEAEARALQQKITAEAKRKAEEAKRKEAEKLAKEAKAKKKVEVIQKKKKADPETKSEGSKKMKPKKKSVKRKAHKKHRRERKKRSPPKT